MKLSLRVIFFLILVLPTLSFPQTQKKNAPKKHKNTDTVGVVNGVVIRLYDFKQQLEEIFKEHKSEIKDSVISDTAFTRFVNEAWDKLVSGIIIEEELEKRNLTLTTEKTIDLILKLIPKKLKETFTDSTGKFDEKALKAYLKNPYPDIKRTQILDYYQTLLNNKDLPLQ